MEGASGITGLLGGPAPLLAGVLLVEEPGALGALGIEWPMLVAQIVNFALLLLLLRVFLYRPVLHMLQQRRERIAESMRQAEEIRQQLTRAQQDYEAALHQAHVESQEIVARAIALGNRLTEEAHQRAEAEAQADIERAREQIHLETQQAVNKLRAEVADLAVLAAGRILERSLDKAAHYGLVEDILRETDKLKVE